MTSARRCEGAAPPAGPSTCSRSLSVCRAERVGLASPAPSGAEGSVTCALAPGASVQMIRFLPRLHPPRPPPHAQPTQPASTACPPRDAVTSRPGRPVTRALPPRPLRLVRPRPAFRPAARLRRLRHDGDQPMARRPPGRLSLQCRRHQIFPRRAPSRTRPAPSHRPAPSPAQQYVATPAAAAGNAGARRDVFQRHLCRVAAHVPVALHGGVGSVWRHRHVVRTHGHVGWGQL
jgi:hypothetical protein